MTCDGARWRQERFWSEVLICALLQWEHEESERSWRWWTREHTMLALSAAPVGFPGDWRC